MRGATVHTEACLSTIQKIAAGVEELVEMEAMVVASIGRPFADRAFDQYCSLASRLREYASHVGVDLGRVISGLGGAEADTVVKKMAQERLRLIEVRKRRSAIEAIAKRSGFAPQQAPVFDLAELQDAN